MLILMVTAAPGDQPASINDLAKVPEVPKVAADSNARPNPARVATC